LEKTQGTQAHNWEVLKIQEVDEGLKQHYGMDIQNKVVYACKSQYLAQAIKEDPNITLIVPCRFAVYRVGATGEAASGKPDDCRGGKVVVGVADPVHEPSHWASSSGARQRSPARSYRASCRPWPMRSRPSERVAKTAPDRRPHRPLAGTDAECLDSRP
jgi:Domain of unknown function DUF302